MTDAMLQAVYDFIYQYFKDNASGPTFNAILKGVDGLKSNSRVHEAVNQLIKVGMVEVRRSNGRKASRTLAPVGVVVTMPEPKQYENEYMKYVARHMSQETGRRVELTIDGETMVFSPEPENGKRIDEED